MTTYDKLFDDLCHVLRPLGERKCGELEADTIKRQSSPGELEPITPEMTPLDYAQSNWLVADRRCHLLQEALDDLEADLAAAQATIAELEQEIDRW